MPHFLLCTFSLLLFVALVCDFGPGALKTARGILAGPRQDVWQQVQKDGKIHFGVDSNDWPFAAVDGQGHYIGLNADLGRALAKALNVQVEFVPVGYDGAYDALRLKECDVLIGVQKDDPARLADFIYTRAYFDAGQVIVTRTRTLARTDDTDCSNLKSLSVFIGANLCPDLRGQRIAVELGSEADAAARRIARRTPNVTLIERDSPEQALEAVQAGEADAALADAVWAHKTVAAQPDLRILPDAVQPYPLALAARADSPRLRTALDRALAQLEADGILQAMLAQWLDKP